ncbi:DNA polymerase III subunit delta [Sulfurovum sp.]|jgi:DNA polymerase-3 subunit delta|uniref:DNA polymerase III subunit delta n=1 Tax=Sulfurovum sp. TaxID=1969726 RepID=UPI002A36B947|nr:DNA polymerase III subunit delta [Sulfurovum sp.]MDY0403131.1 DNA polymerase III subunit delta [Sulfurovum sp.]
MYQKEFNQRLQSTLPKALLLYGENDYLIDYYIDYFIKKLDAKESMLSLYHDEWDFEQAKAFLSQSSLFGGTNLVVAKRDKKIPKKELDLLVELANKNEDNYFIYGYGGAAKDAKSMQASFSEKKGGVWVRFFEPNIREGVATLQQKAQQIRLDIDHYALQHLMLVLNNNLALCANELDKLAILGTKVTSKDIDRLVYSTAPLAIEQLLIELFQKKPITDTITRLLELGEDEASILRATQYFVNQIFLFHAYIKLHGGVDSAAILGYKLPKQIEEQKASLALRVKSAALLKIFEHLLESEIEIKKAPATQREVLLYSMLIKIQGYL